MEKSSLITNLKNNLEKDSFFQIISREYDLKIYIFGSFFKKEKPNDLDILITYNDALKLENYIEFKNEISRLFLGMNLSLKIDLLFLSSGEEIELNFVGNESAQSLF